MADWIVGDIHGSFGTLSDLLRRIDWREGRDRLFSVGDLVNRGPDSLEVLRWFSKTEGVHAVLGNHDLHLLARVAGIRKHRVEDRFEELLAAPDAGELLDWLSSRPFLQRLAGTLVLHAGVLPQWNFARLEVAARECSEILRTKGIAAFFGKGKKTRHGEQIQVLTRLRIVDGEGMPDFEYVRGINEIPAGKRPWFEKAEIFEEGFRVIFGHWAMLGLYRGKQLVCLDSGCIYGGGLSALCLETDEVLNVPSRRTDLWRP